MKYADIPPVWALGSMALAWILARLVPIATIPAAVPVWAGGVVIFAGLCLIVWSALWFRRKATTIEPRHTPDALIVEGPYRLSRNPIYLGMAIILTGWALWLGVLSAFFPIALFVYVITKRFILWEESKLRQVFGDEAVSYLKSTRRW